MSGEVILGTFFGSKIEKAETMSCETNLLEILALRFNTKGLPVDRRNASASVADTLTSIVDNSSRAS